MGTPVILKLPIRLVPRKRLYWLLVVFFGFFFAFSLIWIIGAMQPAMRLEFNDEEVTDPLIRHLFPFFGVPFFLFGAGGLAVCVARVLPRSPFYHLEVSADGLTVRALTKPQLFAWRDMPAFEALEVVTRDSDGTTRSHFAVAMRPDAPAPPPGSKKDPREIVRIPAGEYGRKDNQEAAQMLVDWLNQLRERALKLRLRPGDDIDIPEALCKIALGMRSGANQPQRTQTVTRR